MTVPNLEREETRGLLALGVIGSLVTLRFSHLSFGPDIDFGIDIILFVWGAYAFLMAIAISGEDWVHKPVADHCYFYAHILFLAGIAAIPAVAWVLFFSFLSSLLSSYISLRLITALEVGSSVTIGFLVGRAIMPRRTND
jgi:hypothetical protein